jgi:hypothetical protein
VSFDLSRVTFDPWKNFSGVVMEQGRVQLDSDWNEWLAELARRIQAGTLDVMGHAAYPPTTPAAFLITAKTGSPNTVTIGLGRMYVDGLLAENHGDPAKAVFDTALAELSGTPQPPDPAHPNLNPIDFLKQPWLPGVTLPTDNGAYLFYLDVWTREVDYLQDPDLVDEAVGVDTTGRLQLVWQVKYMPNTGNWTCATPDSDIPYPASSAGQLTTDVQPNQSAGPCCLTDGTGYTGQENQLYRIEIHTGGTGKDKPDSKTATFKWSRDNGSVETSVLGITTVQNSVNATASQLSVTSLGRDQVLGFKAGDWVELLDDWSELWGNPGVMCQVDSVIVSPPALVLTGTVSTAVAAPGPGVPASFPVNSQNQTDAKRHTRLRRWDQSGKVYDIHGNQWCDLATTGGVIPVPASDTTLVLENGITAQFSLSVTSGTFNAGDYWSFAARTARGTVEKLKAAPPIGIHHHYTKLSTVTFTSPNASSPDCRTPWTLGEDECGCCCTATVGDNSTSFGKYSSIQAAINSLPTSGPNVGGEVCILPGRYYEYVSLVGLSDVVIHGCGAQTRLASPTMNANYSPNQSPAANGGASPESGFGAIITVIGSTDVTLRDFCIEAADDEAGILLDGQFFEGHQRIPLRRGTAGTLDTLSGGNSYATEYPANVTIEDLAITASTLPAVMSVNTYLLKVLNNRIAMKDANGFWASIYLGGAEIHCKKNWIGLADSANATEWMPQTVVNDVNAVFNSANAPAAALANGGIHVPGGATDVFITENEIEGGSFNGITLGSFSLVEKGTGVTVTVTGVRPRSGIASTAGETLILPTTTKTVEKDATVVAGSAVQNVLIARNRIRNMGLCGIGPVGFFNLIETLEVITLVNLTIAENTIEESLQANIAPITTTSILSLGYGAICVPDCQNLIVRDNKVTDFGIVPGARVCGVYVLNGEQVEICRNQVIETRDWNDATTQSATNSGGPQAGIQIVLVTPPPLNQIAQGADWQSSFAQGSNIAKPLYQPGLPALRVESNVVRLPLGLAFAAFGFGPFSITGNHFASGGAISVATTGTLSNQGAATGLEGHFYSNTLTVEIINLGVAVEITSIEALYSRLFNNGTPSAFQVGNNPLALSSSGAVLFADNMCQLENRASGAQGITSVTIASLDHLIFSNNHCWVDGQQTAVMDALLVAGSLQVANNRFQEAFGSVFISGLTFGLSNITTHNTATYCLLPLGVPKLSITSPNIVFDTQYCPDLAKQ